MKKVLLWILLTLFAVMPLFGMTACGGAQTSEPNDPNDPTAQPSGPDTQDPTVELPSVPSEREVTVSLGGAIHENTFGRIPQGLVEVVNQYMTTYEGMNLEGVKTTFQTNTYSDYQKLPTDAVMVYYAPRSGTLGAIKEWAKLDDTYELHMMTIINRTDDERYLAEHADEIMTDKTGTKLTNGAEHYMMPCDEWTEYVWSFIEPALDAASFKTIVFEEPDLYKESGYSATFKREWEKYYGEVWVDQTSSPEAMVRSQQLKVYLLNRMMETIVTRVREKCPDIKVYIALHSTPSYNVTKGPGKSGIPGLVSGMNHYLNAGLYDGMIGQTWTDTAGATLMQNGTTFSNRFLAGYLGYASYIDAAGDRELFTLADPVGDGIKTNRTEEYYIPHYFDTIVAQLMQPAINRYQVMVWPDRAFVAASQDFKAIQQSIIKAQLEVTGKAAVQSAGTPGISYVLSDSLTYQNNANLSWAPSSSDSLLGMTLPLLTDGIPLTITSMEQIRSTEDLAGVNLLLLSFDGQKPMDEDVCRIIADWIREGGVCLYVGGHDEYDRIEGKWWSEQGTPLGALLDALELDASVTAATVGEEARPDWVGEGKQVALESLLCSTSYNHFYSAFEGDVNAILKLNDFVVGIDEQIGKGHLVAVSLPAALFTTESGGSEAMRALAEYACQYAEYQYDSTSLMWSKRGNVVAAYSLGRKNVLTGRYIDLFDTQLGLHTHYVMDANESALLYDISNIEITDTPRVLFSGGQLTVSEESTTVTKFKVESPENATVATRILLPDGLYPKSITGTNYKGNIKVECLSAWDSTTDSLLVRFSGLGRGVNVTIEWTTDPVADYPLQQSAAVAGFAPIVEQADLDVLVKKGKTVLRAVTNQSGNTLDHKFIVGSNAQAGKYNYYCDGTNEIVWRVDLTVYKNAYVALMLSQNYLLEVSTDGKSWTEIQNFIKVNGNRIDANTNTYIVGVDSQVYAKDSDQMYLRLSNAEPGKGYGGAVSEYQIYFDAPYIEETDPADYAPLCKDLAAYDAAYAALNKRTVASNKNGDDAEFIYLDRAQASASLRYCDCDHEILLKIDLHKYEDAVVALQISQNYRIQVSANDVTYVTVRDWLLAGNEWSNAANNRAYLIIDSAVYAKDADALYIRIDNAGTDQQGWGAALHSITLYYGGEAVVDPSTPDVPEIPTLPEIGPESYAPLASDLVAYDAKYAARNKREVASNVNGEDKEFVHSNTSVAGGTSRYCDGNRALVLRFDLTTYENAVIALNVSQNYSVQISFDGKTFVTVQDWLLAGNEWISSTANRTYVILDSTAYAQHLDTLYVKLTNADVTQNWGGALHGFTIYYEGDEVKVEMPEIEDVSSYLPVTEDDTTVRAELSETYAKSETIIVNSLHAGEDAAFIAPGGDTIGIDKNCKFCDGARSLTYLFDLNVYSDAVVLMKISNNYNLRVSSDGESWTTVQDYVNANGGTRIMNASNKCWIVLDSAALLADATQMYVRMGNSGNAGGYGGAVYEFTVFYNE